MRAWSLLLVVCALLASCHTNGAPGGPVDAAVKFYEAGKALRCSEVWRTFTAGTQENIRAQVHRYERERDGLPRTELPEEKYCRWTEGTLKRGTARIARQQGDETVVAAEFIVKEITTKNFFPRFPTVTKELRLVREGGSWRVELPRVPIGRPHVRLVEVGPVDVFYPAKFSVGLADRLEATVVVGTPRDALESALRDATFWARALPSVKAVQPLEPTGEGERVQLSFTGADHSLTVTSSPPSKPFSTGSEAAVVWVAEGGNKAPVYFRGSWRLAPYPDGTRITLLLVVILNQWPGDAAEGSFSAERMAQAVLSLEKAALKSAP